MARSIRLSVRTEPVGQRHEAYRVGFDGLRAIAVTLVWLTHLNATGSGSGAIGVDIFFVLSGYLITGVLAEEHRRRTRINLRNFYMRRVLRLTPAFWLLLLTLLAWYAVERPAGLGLLGAIAASGTYIMNWNRIYHWMGEWCLGHTWSLAIEEQFYLIWPLVLFILPRKHWPIAAFGSATLSAIWLLVLAAGDASVDRLYNGLDCHVSGLFLGAGCALLGSRARERMARAVNAMGVISTLGLGLLLFFARMQQPIDPMEIASVTVASSICTAALILAIDFRWAERWLSFRPVVFIGRCSYGIYLWHYPLLGVFAYYHLAGAMTLLTIPLTLVIAGLSFYYVERPILRFKEHFSVSNGRLSADVPRAVSGQPKIHTSASSVDQR